MIFSALAIFHFRDGPASIWTILSVPVQWNEEPSGVHRRHTQKKVGDSEHFPVIWDKLPNRCHPHFDSRLEIIILFEILENPLTQIGPRMFVPVGPRGGGKGEVNLP